MSDLVVLIVGLAVVVWMLAVLTLLNSIHKQLTTLGARPVLRRRRNQRPEWLGKSTGTPVLRDR
jgi:hypothetical protein